MKNRWDDREQALAAPAGGPAGQLCLYTAGPGRLAELAEANVRRCCETHFAGQYELEVVDLRQQPERAGQEQLLALPALVRRYPQPQQYLVGTLADETRLVTSLRTGYKA